MVSAVPRMALLYPLDCTARVGPSHLIKLLHDLAHDSLDCESKRSSLNVFSRALSIGVDTQKSDFIYFIDIEYLIKIKCKE